MVLDGARVALDGEHCALQSVGARPAYMMRLVSIFGWASPDELLDSFTAAAAFRIACFCVFRAGLFVLVSSLCYSWLRLCFLVSSADRLCCCCLCRRCSTLYSTRCSTLYYT